MTFQPELSINPHEHDGVVTTLEILDASSYLSSPESRLAYFQNLEFEEFIGLITTINESCTFDVNEAIDPNDHRSRLIRSITIDEETGKQSEVRTAYLAPPNDHRETLLREALATAQSLNDIEQAATLTGLALSVIHPFQDGNGRTSRVLYGLLTQGYDGSETSKEYFRALSSQANKELVYFHPASAQLPGRFVENEMRKMGLTGLKLDMYPERGDNRAWKIHRLLYGKTLQATLLEEGYFSLLPLFDKMQRDGKQFQDCSKSLAVVDGTEWRQLEVTKIYPDPNAIAVSKLQSAQLRLKLQYVRAVIDCFKPDATERLVDAAELTQLYRPRA
ncbi:MAG TPA: Fic family protein [Candidatus Saccharimonadales bacterium]|nr:Fic family protein [Candidatus Saccharimonadales bacterium]